MSFRARARSARSRSAVATAASRSGAGRPTGGESIASIWTVQESRCVVSRISSRRRSSASLMAAVCATMSCSSFDGGLRLCRHEVERRRLSDVHPRLVDPHQFLRQIERLLARFDVGPGRHQIPVGALHGRGRAHEALAQPRVGDVAVDTARRKLVARRIDEEIAEERLRHVDREPRLQQRVVGVEEAVAVGVHRVP